MGGSATERGWAGGVRTKGLLGRGQDKSITGGHFVVDWWRASVPFSAWCGDGADQQPGTCQ